MKRVIIVLIALVAFSSCQEQQKIAFIDNGDVINDYQMKIDIEKKYEDQNNAFSKRRDSIRRVYQMEVQTIQMQLSKMSLRKQEEESQKFQQKWQPVQQQMQYEQQLMEQGFNKEMDSVISKVNDFVDGYGKKNGYTFILGKNQAGSVLYGAEANDITKEVIKAINLDYGAKADESKDEEAKNTSEEEDTTEE